MKTFASFFLFIAIASFTVSCNNDDDSNGSDTPENVMPTVTLLKVKNITAGTAEVEVLVEGDLHPQHQNQFVLGVTAYNQNQERTVERQISTSGTYSFKFGEGDFTMNNYPEYLLPNTSYSVKAYIRYEEEENYSPEMSLTTCGYPGESGGIVFFDKGEFTEGWQYLEVVQSNDYLSPFNELEESIINWGCYNETIGAYNDGYENTVLITENCGENTMGKLCSDAVIYNKDDWFLPSSEETRALFDLYHLTGWASLGASDYHRVLYSSTESSTSTNFYKMIWIDRHGSMSDSSGDKSLYITDPIFPVRRY